MARHRAGLRQCRRPCAIRRRADRPRNRMAGGDAGRRPPGSIARRGVDRPLGTGAAQRREKSPDVASAAVAQAAGKRLATGRGVTRHAIADLCEIGAAILAMRRCTQRNEQQSEENEAVESHLVRAAPPYTERAKDTDRSLARQRLLSQTIDTIPGSDASAIIGSGGALSAGRRIWRSS